MGKIIVITGAKGGCGKTTLAAALGWALAEMGKSACLCDLCLGQRGLDLALGLENKVVFDLGDLACEDCTMEQALVGASISNLSMIAAPAVSIGQEAGEKLLQKALPRLQKRFDYLVLDTPGAFDSLTQTACKMADDVVLVTVPGNAAARNTERASALLHDLTQAPLHLLMNCLDKKQIAAGRVPAPEAQAAYLDVPLIGNISLHEALYEASLARRLPGEYPERIRKEVFDTARRLCGEDIPLKPCVVRRFPWHSFANN